MCCEGGKKNNLTINPSHVCLGMFFTKTGTARVKVDVEAKEEQVRQRRAAEREARRQVGMWGFILLRLARDTELDV